MDRAISMIFAVHQTFLKSTPVLLKKIMKFANSEIESQTIVLPAANADSNLDRKNNLFF